MYRGQWETLAFFGGGFVFGIVRENIVALLPMLYTYPNHPLYIGAAPIMMGFGWSASFYASWSMAETIREAFAPDSNERWTIPIMTAVITGALSIPVEVAAGAPETLWWVWPAEAITVLYEMPAIVPFGWAGAGFLFVLFFREIMKGENMKRRAIQFVAITLVVILLHLLYVLGVRTVIVLFLG
jgi:hypothetical protein